MRGYKVFNPDWTCRGFQYAVGKTFEENVIPLYCKRGFHFCTELKDCFTARGDIYSIELTQQEDALEIWIKSFSDSKMYCYYLFPYDFGVIEIDKTGGHSYE